MNSAKAVPLAAVVLKCGKTWSRTSGMHLLGRRVPDMRPAQVLLIVLEAPLEGLARALLAVLVARFVDVEQARDTSGT